MTRSLSRSLATTAVWLLVGFSTTQAHTWVEDIMHVAPNGTLVGPAGYARGTVKRGGSPNPDAFMVNKLLFIDDTTPICGPNQQIGSQTPDFPVLKGTQGETIAVRYLENGHVTMPQVPEGKPAGAGTVYIYGTAKPTKTDTLNGILRKWTTDGKGGDGRGVLLATRPFDDGQCYEVNQGGQQKVPFSKQRQTEFPTKADGANVGLPCQNDFKIPDDAAKDYTIYWVWDWPTLGPDGKVVTKEVYTQCIDLAVSPKSQSTTKAKAVSFEQGQPIASAAVREQLTNQYLIDPNPKAPQLKFVSFGAPLPSVAAQQSGAPDKAAPTGKSSASASASTSAAPKPTASQSKGPGSGPGNGGFITITVTAKPDQVTVTKTMTVDGAQATADDSSPVKSSVTKSPIAPTTSVKAPTKTNILPIPAAKNGADAPAASKSSTPVQASSSTTTSAAATASTAAPKKSSSSPVAVVETTLVIPARTSTVSASASATGTPVAASTPPFPIVSGKPISAGANGQLHVRKWHPRHFHQRSRH